MTVLRAAVPLFLALLWAGPALALDYEMSDGKVRALDGHRVRWENLFDRSGTFDEKRLHPPVLAGDRIYYGVGPFLYDVRADTGVVNRVIALPGEVSRLGVVGENLSVLVRSEAAGYDWRAGYTVRPDGHDVPFTLSGSLLAARLPRRVAEGLLDDLLKAAVKDGRLKKLPAPEVQRAADPACRPLVEEAAAELGRLWTRDPTNPWLAYCRGDLLLQLGRREEGRSAFREALALPPAYRWRLLNLVFPLDQHDESLGDEAYRLAMTDLVSKGFEPELMNVLISVMIYYGAPLDHGKDGRAFDPATELDRMNRIGERLWDFSPYTEGACYAFHALAEHNEAAGRVDEAARWRRRRDAASPWRIFGGANRSAERGGHALTVMMAAGLAVLLLLAVKLTRVWSTWRRAARAGVGQFNVFVCWSKGEIAGYLLVCALGVGATWVATRGVSAISYAASVPLTALNGFIGHPDAVAYFAKARGTEGGDLVYAMALHKAGKLEEAASVYGKLSSAQALNNLGVLHHQKGDGAGARAWFQKALAADGTLAVARRNLGEEAASPRIVRLEKYGATPPFFAMPTEDQWSEMMTGREGRGTLSAAVEVLSLQGSLSGEAGHLAGGSVFGSVSSVLLAAVSLFVLMALFQRDRSAPFARRSRSSTVGWLLGFLVPGAARQWSFLGPLVLVLFLFSYLVSYYYGRSDGVATNLIDAIAIPGVARAFGFGDSTYRPPLSDLVARARILWWVIWLANLVYLGAMTRIWPDPVGLMGRQPLVDDGRHGRTTQVPDRLEPGEGLPPELQTQVPDAVGGEPGEDGETDPEGQA